MGVRTRAHPTGMRIRNSMRIIVHWLATLPKSADAGHDIFACHGTPTDDNRYLVEEVSAHRGSKSARSSGRKLR
jgi:hypothetical protein